MKVNIQEMMQNERNTEKSFLQMKKKLKELKESGEIFFIEDVATLNLEDEFQLYFYAQSSKRTDVNAFPIDKLSFGTLSKNEAERIQELSDYFYKYYDIYPPKTWFKKHSYKCFKAKDRVWMYFD
jgi:hypothetical protein